MNRYHSPHPHDDNNHPSPVPMTFYRMLRVLSGGCCLSLDLGQDLTSTTTDKPISEH